jgi:hypothetical protein
MEILRHTSTGKIQDNGRSGDGFHHLLVLPYDIPGIATKNRTVFSGLSSAQRMRVLLTIKIINKIYFSK